MAELTSRVAELDALMFEIAPLHPAAQAPVLRFRGSLTDRSGRPSTRKRGLDLIDQGTGLEVSGRHEGQVVGRIPTLEEIHAERLIKRGYALHGSQDRSPVGVDLIGLSEGQLREDMARCVVGPSDLLKNDFLFAPDFLGVEERVLDRVGEHIDSGQ